MGAGADPVPAEWRAADPARDAHARDLERDVGVEIHVDYEDPLDLGQTEQDQRMHYVFYPEGLEPDLRPNRGYVGRLTAGFVYWLAGAWFWQPHWATADSPLLTDLDIDREPSVELEVATEQEAKLHAVRRLAWELAGEGGEA